MISALAWILIIVLDACPGLCPTLWDAVKACSEPAPPPTEEEAARSAARAVYVGHIWRRTRIGLWVFIVVMLVVATAVLPGCIAPTGIDGYTVTCTPTAAGRTLDPDATTVAACYTSATVVVCPLVRTNGEMIVETLTGEYVFTDTEWTCRCTPGQVGICAAADPNSANAENANATDANARLVVDSTSGSH